MNQTNQIDANSILEIRIIGRLAVVKGSDSKNQTP